MLIEGHLWEWDGGYWGWRGEREDWRRAKWRGEERRREKKRREDRREAGIGRRILRCVLGVGGKRGKDVGAERSERGCQREEDVVRFMLDTGM